MERTDPLLLTEGVKSAVHPIVAERSGQRIGQRVGGIVDDLEFEHGGRH